MSKLEARFLKQFWVDEAPSGAVNGANVTFTLAQTPLENGSTEPSVDLYIDGLYQTPGVDYTISGVTITMTVAPVTDQIIRASYIRRTGGA